jgi:hypothetical protein
MARWTSTATTEESIPPDSAQSTRWSPTWRRIVATASSTNDAMLQPGVSRATRKRKFWRMRLPCRVCATSGWNCTATSRRPESAMAATGLLAVRARQANPGGGASTVSPWLIQTGTTPAASASTPSKSASRARRRTSAGPYSRCSDGSTFPPSRAAIACMP